MAEGCKRLIKNAIVCWNYLYLTQKIAEAPDAETRKALLESVAVGSAGIRPPKLLSLPAS